MHALYALIAAAATITALIGGRRYLVLTAAIFGAFAFLLILHARGQLYL